MFPFLGEFLPVKWLSPAIGSLIAVGRNKLKISRHFSPFD
jgi:hypothetical protein